MLTEILLFGMLRVLAQHHLLGATKNKIGYLKNQERDNQELGLD